MVTVIKLLTGVIILGTVAWFATSPQTPQICRTIYSNSLSGASFACRPGVASISLRSLVHSPVDVTSSSAVGVWTYQTPAPVWSPNRFGMQVVGPGEPLRLSDADRHLLYVQADRAYVLTVAFERGMVP